MSYIENNLMNGERIIYRSKLHWVIFFWPIIISIFATIIIKSNPEIAGLGILIFLFAILSGTSSFIDYLTSKFCITNKRVIVKVGFIRRHSIELLLNKVEGIQVTQGVIGRILGFGSIVVSGTGGTKDPFHKIESPLEFRRKALEQITSVQDSK